MRKVSGAWLSDSRGMMGIITDRPPNPPIPIPVPAPQRTRTSASSGSHRQAAPIKHNISRLMRAILSRLECPCQSQRSRRCSPISESNLSARWTAAPPPPPPPRNALWWCMEERLRAEDSRVRHKERDWNTHSGPIVLSSAKRTCLSHTHTQPHTVCVSFIYLFIYFGGRGRRCHFLCAKFLAQIEPEKLWMNSLKSPSLAAL